MRCWADGDRHLRVSVCVGGGLHCIFSDVKWLDHRRDWEGDLRYCSPSVLPSEELRLATGSPWMSPQLKTSGREDKPQAQCFPRGLRPLNWNTIMFLGFQGTCTKPICLFEHLLDDVGSWANVIPAMWFSDAECDSNTLFPTDIRNFKVGLSIMQVDPLNLGAGIYPFCCFKGRL